MSDVQVMQIPIRRFWLMSGMVGRLRAEQDMRSLSISCAPHSGKEGLKDIQNNLRDEMNSPIIAFDAMDREGMNKLRTIFGVSKKVD